MARKARSGSSSSSSGSSNSSGDDAQSNGKRWWRRSKPAASKRCDTAYSAGKAALLTAVQKVLPATSMTQHSTPVSTNENSPLLHDSDRLENGEGHQPEAGPANFKVRCSVWGLLTAAFLAAIILILCFPSLLGDALSPWLGGLPKDPLLAAYAILAKAPVIDGHIDLPELVRSLHANNASAVNLEKGFVGHVDIERLRKGKVGAFFWSVYVSCANPEAEGEDFLGASWRVRDTLEQIDVSRLLIDKYPETFRLATSSHDIRRAIVDGKIASMLGVEGGHQLGNSISVLRQYHQLGVRYVTLTHTCHNAFADSAGFLPGIKPLHGGLSDLGRSLIDEMNRLGVLVDLSHTSDAAAEQALLYSKAPVIWSHSSARAIHDVPRNVPDNILRLIGWGVNQTDGVVMVNFFPFFVAPPGKATVAVVADHVEHIANIAGREHVGIGSDFDGIGEVPVGLEDVSKYPALVAELISRGWSKYDIAGFTGGNFLRVFEGAERVARELQEAGASPVYDLYKKRKDLPVRDGSEL